MLLKRFLTIIIGTIGKNKYFILHWQNIGKTLAIGTMHWQQLVNHWQKSVCENSDLPK